MPHKQEAVNQIRCGDEWTPASELLRDPCGSFELAIGSVFARSGEGGSVVVTLWYGHQALSPLLLSANVSVSKWDWHRPETFPAEVLWNQRSLKWTSACVQSAPRNPFQILGLQMWPLAAWRHFWHRLVGWLQPCPRRLGPLKTTTTNTTTSTALTTSSRPWAGL